MEFLSPPSTSPYVTAPTSPTSYMVQYHSAATSPGKRFGRTTTDGDYELTLSDFEFETSKKFDNCMEFETCENVEHSEDDQSWHEKRRERGGSLPEMAFADEIFSNGQVMPLKLPPRLQCDNDMKYTSQRSITCSTIAPSAMVKSPFARRNVDPFVIAMQKVMKEENRGRNFNSNHHKRTRSLSPFRANNMEWTIEEMRQEIVSMTPIQPSSPNPTKPIESKAKGASYGRWVLDHSMTIGPGPKVSKKPKNLLFGKKEPKPNKPTSKGDMFVETKMQKFKGMLVKYASFRKENSEGKMNNPILAIWKPNYFKKLSFKFKGNGNGNVNIKANGVEPKLVIVKYKPALCLGYGLEKA
ncbi:PREDICTED: uncharacterized protein LOC109213702 [Nicotiana attenuata]|uniref:Uncharacterized protein n=1 Tax=Nicotiana attenuata TaxID=49451 RepID=A0A1J6KC27_NICAT|nr:PREDICTED: uncharacterized protein LOC109213702 [Nicotiana attenuata]OIT27618.1 hypothetical protein A4A49_22415 [Nicotiana attenuata]